MIELDAEAFIIALTKASDSFAHQAKWATYQAAADAVRFAKASTAFNDQTTRLRKSIRIVSRGLYEHHAVAGGIGKVNYALWVEERTRAHWIPKTGRTLLTWIPSGGGPRAFAMRVRHPGTTAKHFMRDAGRAAEALFIPRVRGIFRTL